MSKVFCLLNHELTIKQISELEERFHITEIHYPDKFLKELWSNIPTMQDLDVQMLVPFITWLESGKSGDMVVLQGEFGSTFFLVDYCLGRGLVPIHSVTQRIAKESRNGEIVKRSYVFEHICFRKYKRVQTTAGR
jgi:hypothetical protein